MNQDFQNSLILDCAVSNISLAITNAAGHTVTYHGDHKSKQSEDLLPLIMTTLSRAELSASDIKKIFYADGPGAFTSLRVGLATLKGLFFGQDLQYFPVSSLRLRHDALLATHPQHRIFVTVPMGRDRFILGMQTENGFEERLVTSSECQKVMADKFKGPYVIAGAKSGEHLADFTSQAAAVINEDFCDPKKFISIINNLELNSVSFSLAPVRYGMAPDIG